LGRPEAADPAPDHDSDAAAVDAVEVDPRVLARLIRGDQRELDVAVEVADFLPLEQLLGLPALHLGGDLDREVLGREERDAGGSALSGLDARPERARPPVAGVAERGDGAEPRDDDPALSVSQRGTPPRPSPLGRLLARVLLDVLDGLADGLDLLGVLVRDAE